MYMYNLFCVIFQSSSFLFYLSLCYFLLFYVEILYEKTQTPASVEPAAIKA